VNQDIYLFYLIVFSALIAVVLVLFVRSNQKKKWLDAKKSELRTLYKL
jgi:hypothetical protein